MNRQGFEHTRFFVGNEVEHTPALGRRTLFVVGIADVYDVATEAKKNLCTHIYFGANQSFPQIAANNALAWAPWEKMIAATLEEGFWCTLDIDVSCVEGLLESGLTEHHRFIPMISVKLPYLQQLGYNATIKLDDTDFAKSNPGVWCHRLHTLMSPDCFTAWDQYNEDSTL